MSEVADDGERLTGEAGVGEAVAHVRVSVLVVVSAPTDAATDAGIEHVLNALASVRDGIGKKDVAQRAPCGVARRAGPIMARAPRGESAQASGLRGRYGWLYRRLKRGRC